MNIGYIVRALLCLVLRVYNDYIPGSSGKLDLMALKDNGMLFLKKFLESQHGDQFDLFDL